MTIPSSTRARSSLGFAAAALLAASGCPRAAGEDTRTPSETSPETTGGASVDDAGGEAPGDAPPLACGSPGLRVEELAWLPGTTRAVVLVDLDDPDRSAALAVLAARARATGHGMPIDLAFTFGEWTWQIPALAGTLARVGLAPGNVVYVHTAEPTGAFVLQHDCDVERLRAAMTEAWGVSWRTLVEGALGRATEGTAFAWDVLLLPGGRAMLVAKGRGDAWLRALVPDPARSGVATHMKEMLGRVGAAPIRGVIAGPSLLDPGAQDVAFAQTLHGTADALTLGPAHGDTLPAPP